MIDLRCPGHVQLKSVECHSGILGRNATQAVFKMAAKMASKKNKNDYKFENICFIKQQKSAIIIVRDYTCLKHNNI